MGEYIAYVGLDVHKDTMMSSALTDATAAVCGTAPGGAAPRRVAGR